MVNAILKICMDRGFFLDKETLELLSGLDEGVAVQVFDLLKNTGMSERVINRLVLSKNFDKIQDVVELCDKDLKQKLFGIGVQAETDIEESGRIKILSSPVTAPKKVFVEDFVKHFRAR